MFAGRFTLLNCIFLYLPEQQHYDHMPRISTLDENGPSFHDLYMKMKKKYIT